MFSQTPYSILNAAQTPYIGAGVPRAGDNILLFPPLRIRPLTGHDPEPPERGKKHRESDTSHFFNRVYPPSQERKDLDELTYLASACSSLCSSRGRRTPPQNSLGASVVYWWVERVLSSYRTGSHTHTVFIPARGVGV